MNIATETKVQMRRTGDDAVASIESMQEILLTLKPIISDELYSEISARWNLMCAKNAAAVSLLSQIIVELGQE